MESFARKQLSKNLFFVFIFLFYLLFSFPKYLIKILFRNLLNLDHDFLLVKLPWPYPTASENYPS